MAVAQVEGKTSGRSYFLGLKNRKATCNPCQPLRLVDFKSITSKLLAICLSASPLGSEVLAS